MSTKYDIGVVVGRFQVPELHEGHRKLLELVQSEVKNLLVLIGVAPALGTKENPLDFTSRARMIQTAFPSAIVLPLLDRPTNQEWSKNLDLLVRTTFPMGTVALYGSRDSFTKEYKGHHKVVRVEEFTDTNGTAIRKDAGKTIINSADFRAGIIYSTQNQYPKVWPTVDVAVTRKDHKEVLLGSRSENGVLIFPGGFVDPTDETLEAAAMRELHEEAGGDLDLGGVDAFSYVGSFQINDWRYKNEERILTSLFTAELSFGTPKPSEELQSIGFYPLTKKTRQSVSPSHQPLFDALLNHFGKKGEHDEI